MATRPVIRNLNATSVGLINWTVAKEGGYLAGAPYVTDTVQSFRQFGEFINAFQARQNTFLHALVNRIAMVIIATKSYTNPWEWVKKGTLDYGETIEEIYVNLAKAEDFLVEPSTNDILADNFKQRIPDVQAAFHSVNFMKKYPVSVSRQQLYSAFNSMDGVMQLVDYIVQSLYTAFNYDELAVYQWMLYRMALDGKIHTVTIPAMTAANAKGITSTIKAISNDFTFLKTKYNTAGVFTHTPKEDQYILKSIEGDAIMDVEVLAVAFNMSKAEFAGHHVLLDDYDDAKNARVNELLSDNPLFKAFTDAELTAIRTIEFMILDRNFLMQYDKLVEMHEQPIPADLRWNYFLHHWALFSASPFKNAAIFTTTTSSVTSITVTPSTANALPGNTLAFTATVTATGFGSKDVAWTITGATDEDTKIDRNGVLTLGADETGAEGTGTITVTATSVANSAVSGTATVTIPDLT